MSTDRPQSVRITPTSSCLWDTVFPNTRLNYFNPRTNRYGWLGGLKRAVRIRNVTFQRSPTLEKSGVEGVLLKMGVYYVWELLEFQFWELCVWWNVKILTRCLFNIFLKFVFLYKNIFFIQIFSKHCILCAKMLYCNNQLRLLITSEFELDSLAF